MFTAAISTFMFCCCASSSSLPSLDLARPAASVIMPKPTRTSLRIGQERTIAPSGGISDSTMIEKPPVKAV